MLETGVKRLSSLYHFTSYYYYYYYFIYQALTFLKTSLVLSPNNNIHNHSPPVLVIFLFADTEYLMKELKGKKDIKL